MKKSNKELPINPNLKKLYKSLDSYPFFTDIDRKFISLLIDTAYLAGKVEVREEYAKNLKGGE